jgi:CheY-like chemotaxis protein
MPVYQLLVLTPSPGDVSRFARLLQQTEHAHFTVTPAASGAAGLAALRTHSYDLVVVDVRLSEREGLAVLWEQQLHGRTTPVFVLTAFARQDPLGSVRYAASPDDSGVDSVDAGLLAREMQQAIEYSHGQAHIPPEVASLYRLFTSCNA